MKNTTQRTKQQPSFSLLFIMIVCLSIFFKNTEAQGLKEISGIVYDSATNEPLQGVSVHVKGGNTGTLSAPNGEYSIKADSKDVIVFSFIGYKTQKITVGNKVKINPILQPKSVELNEIVAIGYGTTTKESLTGSVTSIKAKSFEHQPITNPEQILQGAKGLYVHETTGQPGNESISINIRGIGTTHSTAPLVLINGMEGSLTTIDPGDIESITVLKDAASTSIYGTRAANGVILVRTKSGAGAKGTAQVEYRGTFGLQQATVLPDLVTNSVTFMKARNTAAKNEGVSPTYTQEMIDEFKNGSGTDEAMYPNTDWIDIVFRTAPIQKHNISAQGSSDFLNYRVSLSYLNQSGITIGHNSAKKYIVNANLNFNLSKKLKANLIISGFQNKINQPVEGNHQTFLATIMRGLPIEPIYLDDGRYAYNWVPTPHINFRNPVIFLNVGHNYINRYNERANLKIDYSITNNLTSSTRLGINRSNTIQDIFLPRVFQYNPKEPDVPIKVSFKHPSKRSAQGDWEDHFNTTFFSTLHWNKRLNENNTLELLVGFSSLTEDRNNIHGMAIDYLGNGITTLSGGSTPLELSGRFTESRLLSFFGRAKYEFKNRYIFQFNMRYDGSSKFAKGNRWGLFPSLSAAWRINKESFIQNSDVISNLKLRVSWGRVGNQDIGNFVYLDQISIEGLYSFNDNEAPVAAVKSLSDPSISWETTTKANIGLDIGFLSNKLTFHIDVFDDKTSDILARLNIPSQVGNLNGPLVNLYDMSNKGVEFSGDYFGSIGVVRINVGGQFTYVRNNVDFLNGDEQVTTNLFGEYKILKEGYPVGSFYLYKAIGIFQNEGEVEKHAFENTNTAPGDVIYADLNNDDVIDGKDRIITGNSALPKFIYSFNLGLSYSNFHLNARFIGVNGIEAYPYHNIAMPLFNGAGITKKQLAQAWTPNNRDTKYPRLVFPKHGSTVNFYNSTLWLRDASFLRLKNLNFSYTFPKSLIHFVNSLEVFLSGQNLLLLTPFPKFGDPENISGSGTTFHYPINRIYTIGVDIKF